MSLIDILKKEMMKSNGSARLISVPYSRRPTSESLKNLNSEIASQININREIRYRSINKR